MIFVAIAVFLLAAIPAWNFWRSLRLYQPPATQAPGSRPTVSVLIPARNEERGIAAALTAALASKGVELEIVVLDDHSGDHTAALVEEIATHDPRVRLLQAPPLPEGWCGKQHACWVLAQQARHELLLFVDADVRLEPGGVAGMVAFLEASGADLVSGFPRQETGTFLEKLLLPLIHFVLLAFLPFGRMRRSRHPAYAAGCGQLFLTHKSAYQHAGGHAAIRTSLHDGITLPRAYRRAGLATDLCDATGLAVCRMYSSAGEVWSGLAKNATEGLAKPGLLVPVTLLLLGGQVAPFVLLAFAWLLDPVALALVIAAALAAWYPRWAGVWRFRQSWPGALLHPLGILVLLAIQWYALGRSFLGVGSAWKGRSYPEPR
jgi:hypothetical protein